MRTVLGPERFSRWIRSLGATHPPGYGKRARSSPNRVWVRGFSCSTVNDGYLAEVRHASSGRIKQGDQQSLS